MEVLTKYLFTIIVLTEGFTLLLRQSLEIKEWDHGFTLERRQALKQL